MNSPTLDNGMGLRTANRLSSYGGGTVLVDTKADGVCGGTAAVVFVH